MIYVTILTAVIWIGGLAAVVRLVEQNHPWFALLVMFSTLLCSSVKYRENTDETAKKTETKQSVVAPNE